MNADYNFAKDQNIKNMKDSMQRAFVEIEHNKFQEFKNFTQNLKGLINL